MADKGYGSPAPVQYHQPGPTATMTVGGGQRNVKNLPFNSNGERDWSESLCGCFGDCSTCCVSLFCPCIVYSQNKSRLEHLESKGYPHPDGGESCGGDCVLHGLLTAMVGWGWILQIGTRRNIRNRYRIESSAFGDCCASWCCHSCALTQESRELELEERSMIPTGAPGAKH